MKIKFQKYQHISNKLDSKECEGLLNGTLVIQPKLDGSNCQIWMDNGKLRISSRNRVLSAKHDNHGCYQTLKNDERFIKFFTDYPDVKLIGEWLVPHTIKYRDDAYRKLYIFDGIKINTENEYGHAEYIDYSDLIMSLINHGIDYVPYISVPNPENWDKTYNSIIKYFPEFNSLCENEGEGIVIKNYDYTNPFGRKVWCKIINEKFYEIKKSKPPRAPRQPRSDDKEREFVNLKLNDHLLSKQFHKIQDFERKKIGEYIRSCQLEFEEDFIDETVDVDVKIINNIIAREARGYLKRINIL